MQANLLDRIFIKDLESIPSRVIVIVPYSELGILRIATSCPVFDRNNKLMGVLGIDVALSDIRKNIEESRLIAELRIPTKSNQ